MKKLMLCASIAALLASPALAQRPQWDDGTWNHGNQGARPAQPAPAAAPAPAAQPQAQGRPQGGNNGGQGRNDARPDNRGNFGRNDNQRGNDGRNGWNGNNPGNRPGFNRPGNGPRRDYSSFRNYHQSFRSGRRFRAPAYRRPYGWSYQRWSFGQILPSLFWSQQYWLNDYAGYDLPPPPYGAVWVRYGNDALLIDRDSGEIITVEYDVFY